MKLLFLGMILMCGYMCAMDHAKLSNDEWAKQVVKQALEHKKKQQEENEKGLIEWARENSQKKQMSPEQRVESEKALAHWGNKINTMHREDKK